MRLFSLRQGLPIFFVVPDVAAATPGIVHVVFALVVVQILVFAEAGGVGLRQVEQMGLGLELHHVHRGLLIFFLNHSLVIFFEGREVEKGFEVREVREVKKLETLPLWAATSAKLRAARLSSLTSLTSLTSIIFLNSLTSLTPYSFPQVCGT